MYEPVTAPHVFCSLPIPPPKAADAIAAAPLSPANAISTAWEQLYPSLKRRIALSVLFIRFFVKNIKKLK
jgi:hypothetical protein